MPKKLRICITILWISIGFNAWAQRNRLSLREKLDEELLLHGCLSINYGASFPILEFGSTDFGVASSGYAKIGSYWSFQLSYEALDWLGFSINYHELQWPVNTTALASDFQQSNPNIQVQSLSMDNYRLNGMLLGIFMPFRLPNTTYEIKAQAGYNIANLPELNYLIRTSSGNVYNLQIRESTATDPVYTLGLQIKRRLYRNILLTSHAHFLYSEQRYENIYLYNQTLGFSVRLRDYTQYYHAINTGIGLAVQF